MPRFHSAIPDTREAYKETYPLMHQILGGDNIATRAAGALWRAGIRTPQELYAAEADDIGDLRYVGPLTQERIEQTRLAAVDYHMTYVPGRQVIDYSRVVALLTNLVEVARTATAYNEDDRLYVGRLLSTLADRHRLERPARTGKVRDDHADTR